MQCDIVFAAGLRRVTSQLVARCGWRIEHRYLTLTAGRRLDGEAIGEANLMKMNASQPNGPLLTTAEAADYGRGLN